MPVRSDSPPAARRPPEGAGASRAADWSARVLVALMLLGALAGVPAAGAQDVEVEPVAPAAPAAPAPPAAVALSPDEVVAALEQRFELVRLRQGWLLTDRSGGSAGAVEVAGGEVSLAGRVVAADELRRALGEDSAELVLRFAALEQRGEIEPPAVAATAPEADEGPEEEVEPAVEAEGDSGEGEEVEEQRDRRGATRYVERDQPVSVGGALTIEEGDTAKDAMSLGGPLTVYGRVLGDAVALGGSVTVRGGEVTGEVLAIGGSIFLEEGAEVLGGAVSIGGKIHRDEDVVLRGDVVEIPFGPKVALGPLLREAARDGRHDFFDFSPVRLATRSAWSVFGLIVLLLVASLAYLIARAPVERIERKAATEPWKSGLAGLLAQILCIPLLIMVIIILAVSIIGIPLLLLVPFAILAFIVVSFLGYVGVALGLGRFLERRFGWSLASPFLALVVGVVVIQIWWMIGRLLDVGWTPLWFLAAIFCLFGGLVKYVAWTVGMGAAVLTRFGTADGWAAIDRTWPPPPPAEPGGYYPSALAPGQGSDAMEPGAPAGEGWSEPEPPEDDR